MPNLRTLDFIELARQQKAILEALLKMKISALELNQTELIGLVLSADFS
jgi:hypothetical protein